MKYTQPETETLKKLWLKYEQFAEGLTAACHVMSINFQTMAAPPTITSEAEPDRCKH